MLEATQIHQMRSNATCQILFKLHKQIIWRIGHYYWGGQKWWAQNCLISSFYIKPQLKKTIFFSNFAPIRFSTSYHNKAICRRTLILRALFGGLFCYFNRKAIYNGNVVTWSNVPSLLATSFDNNWHFVLILLPVQKRLFRLSSKHLTIN